MDSCSVETGLLRKKPCGQRAVAHCENCERALCASHAVAQLSEAQKKTGKFLCKECDDARREYEKSQARVHKQEEAKRTADMMRGLTNPPPPKPKAAAESAPTAPAAPAAKPQAGAATPPPKEESGALEFTPSAKKDVAAPPKATPAAKPPDDGGLDFTPSEKKPAKPDDGSIDFTPSKPSKKP